MNFRRAMAAGALVVSLGLVAGCSSTDTAEPQSSSSTSAVPEKSVNDVVDEATAAMEAATSVRIVGVWTVNASASPQPTAETSRATEGSVDNATWSSDATLAGGGTVTVLAVNDAYYLNGNEAYWAALGTSADQLPKLVGKWVATPASAAESLANYKPAAMLGALLSDITAVRFTSVDSYTTDEGIAAYRVSNSGTAEMVVDATTMLPISVKTSGDFTSTLSKWNAVEPKTAPPADQVVTQA